MITEAGMYILFNFISIFPYFIINLHYCLTIEFVESLLKYIKTELKVDDQIKRTPRKVRNYYYH